MIAIIIVALCAVLVQGSILRQNKTPDLITLIIGGRDAPEGAYPYQVSLRDPDGSHFCGGSILNDRWILTAAHCTKRQSPDSFIVVVGTNSLTIGGTAYSVEKVIVHGDYNSVLISDDISIVKLQRNIEFNDRVQPIALPDADTEAGADLVVTGWGTTSYPGSPPDKLQIVETKSLSVEQCRERMGSINAVFESEICSFSKSGEGICHGDSGSALVEGNSVVGIASWVMPCARGFPDVYTRVYYFKDWILKNIAENS